VIIGGRSFPVVSVRLAGGGTEITFRIPGPQDAFEGALTVFGADGSGCWQGRIVQVPFLPAHEVWGCCYVARFREVDGAGTEIMPYTVEER
jgi:hypothetical protein